MLRCFLIILVCLLETTAVWSFQATTTATTCSSLHPSVRHERSLSGLINAITTTTTTMTTTTTTTRLYHAADKWSQRPDPGRMERIEFTIYPDGRVEEKVFGIKGEDCRKITENIEKALGVVVHTAPTEEMFEEKVVVQNSVNVQLSQEGGWEGTSTW